MEKLATILEFGGMPRETVFCRKDLANLLRCNIRTIKRMEDRGELPASIWFHGKLCYMLGAIIDHLQRLAKQAQESAMRDRRRLGMEGF
jgi:hypothetical protein